jgi:hypothetical protein
MTITMKFMDYFAVLKKLASPVLYLRPGELLRACIFSCRRELPQPMSVLFSVCHW